MSSELYCLYRAYDFFWNGASVYFPVHTVLLLIRLSRSKKEDRRRILKKYITGLLKSCAFACGYACSVSVLGCYTTKIFGSVRPKLIMALCPFFSIFFLCESSSRWGEMSIWVLGNWLEGLYIQHDKMELLPHIMYFRVS